MTKEQILLKFKQFDFDRVIMIISLALLVVVVWGYYEKNGKLKQTLQTKQALEDTLVVWKNKEGLSKGKIPVIESGNIEAFTKMASKDSTITRLQALVEANKSKLRKQGSATVISIETKIDTTTKTVVDNNAKVIPNGDSPIYTSKIKNKWLTSEIISARGSTKLSVSFKNDMDIVIRREKTGFLGLGKGKTFTEATLHNPYSEIKVLRTYQTQLPREKKIHIGPTLIYGIGQNFNPGVYIGVGATWGVINF